MNTPAFQRSPFALPLSVIVVSAGAAQPGLSKGDEVLAINGEPAAKLNETLETLVPIDGDTVWARAAGLASDGDLMGADFDHFYPFVYGFPPTRSNARSK